MNECALLIMFMVFVHAAGGLRLRMSLLFCYDVLCHLIWLFLESYYWNTVYK